MNYLYKLTENLSNEEPNMSSSDRVFTDLVLIPTNTSIDKTIEALNNMDNYGSYISNLRDVSVNVNKAVEDHFGPSQPFIKKKLEKERGKPFPPKTKQAVDDFIKSLKNKPNILKWRAEGDTLVFPHKSNPTKKTVENIIKTVMNNAQISYKMDEKESLSESIVFSPQDKLFNDVIELIRIRTRKMNDNDVYEFSEKLKKWVNKLI